MITNDGIFYYEEEEGVKKILGNYFHIKLSTNKNIILSDGLDKVLVVAEIYNYENIFQSDNDSIVVFEMGNEKVEVQAVKGKANIEITSSRIGEIKIKASSDGMREGEIIFESI